jgi:Cof subfamily protein (haloacid dehalogenase superfamily)
MSVKLIAVDMDGTFLNDRKQYDTKRFAQLFEEMKQQKIKFVVASGNQFFQLASFFPDHYQEIDFVAENGANILSGTQDIFHHKMSEEVLQKTIGLLERLAPELLIVCGKKSAYVLEDMSEADLQAAAFYYPVIKKVASFNQLDDDIFKLALTFKKEDAEYALQELKSLLQGELVPVTSGHDGDIDLILPGVHKAQGLNLLQKRLSIKKNEIAAFGDHGNDLEMLQLAGYSFAMGNARSEIKEVARYQIGDNNSSAVLDTIEQLLLDPSVFQTEN